jgi:DeoR family transcriptional regulator of aga operon
MNITERHQLILERLQASDRVDIQTLSEDLKVSEVTIRKDLKQLEGKDLLYRVRGGALLNNPYINERPISEKELINAEEKKKIAQKASLLIVENDSIMIGSGTTAFELVRYLHPQKPLTVITPAIKVALKLCKRPNIDVIQLGGILRSSSSSVTGSYAKQILSEISSRILFLGVDGIDQDFGLSTTNLAEATLSKQMIEAAQIRVVMADSTKFGRRGLSKICHINQVQYIITDNKISSEAVKSLEEQEVEVLIAE